MLAKRVILRLGQHSIRSHCSGSKAVHFHSVTRKDSSNLEASKMPLHGALVSDKHPA